MATVFSQVVAFCENNHRCIVSQEKRNEIGKMVSSYYYGTYKDATPLPKIFQIEPDGQFEVVFYPDWFTPKIYEIVENYYRDIKKNRNRIPLKSAYSRVIHPSLRRKIS